MLQKILALTLGGTIDAQAYPTEENAYPAQANPSGNNAAFEALLNLCAPDTQLKQIKVCDKDSKNVSEEDMRQLQHHIQSAAGFSRIIVTIGTDKMREIALDIQSKTPAPPCPVIFTGAIWPISNGADQTDAYDNLKLALEQNRLQNQIYIAMSGYCEPPENLIKDFKQKRFVLYTKKTA